MRYEQLNYSPNSYIWLTGLPCWTVEVPLECGWRVCQVSLDWIRDCHDFRRICCLMVMHFSILVCRDLFLKEGLPGHKQACFSPLIPPYTAVLRLTYVLSNSRHTREMHVAAILLCFFLQLSICFVFWISWFLSCGITVQRERYLDRFEIQSSILHSHWLWLSVEVPLVVVMSSESQKWLVCLELHS